MQIPRVYYPELQQNESVAVLEGQTAQHLGRVLRLKTGDRVILFDGRNHQCQAQITGINKKQVELLTEQSQTISKESNLDITLIQGISRGERMDWTLQKATELGVKRIIPAFTRRGTVKLDEKRQISRMHHWQGVLAHACEQSGRNQLPKLETPCNLGDAISLCAGNTLYFLDPEAGSSIRQLKELDNKLCLIIGPEGGFDNNELGLMTEIGIRGLKLGPRILRTETAGIVALAAIGALYGDL